jgi:hypothetical protein
MNKDILEKISEEATFKQLFMALWWRLFNSRKSKILYHYSIVKGYHFDKAYKKAKEI